MDKDQTNRLLQRADSLLQNLPTHPVKSTDSDLCKLSRKDVVGTAFAYMLIGMGINPSNFKHNSESASYLIEGYSHTSEMSIWHFRFSVRADAETIFKDFKELLLRTV